MDGPRSASSNANTFDPAMVPDWPTTEATGSPPTSAAKPSSDDLPAKRSRGRPRKTLAKQAAPPSDPEPVAEPPPLIADFPLPAALIEAPRASPPINLEAFAAALKIDPSEIERPTEPQPAPLATSMTGGEALNNELAQTVGVLKKSVWDVFCLRPYEGAALSQLSDPVPRPAPLSAVEPPPALATAVAVQKAPSIRKLEREPLKAERLPPQTSGMWQAPTIAEFLLSRPAVIEGVSPGGVMRVRIVGWPARLLVTYRLAQLTMLLSVFFFYDSLLQYAGARIGERIVPLMQGVFTGIMYR